MLVSSPPAACDVLGFGEVTAVEVLGAPACGCVLASAVFGAPGLVVLICAVWSPPAWVFRKRGICVAATTITARAINAPKVM